MKKNKKDICIEVIGGNAEDVTGSCTKITTPNECYLFECGMIQKNHTILENYQDNLKYIIGHCHQDHIGLIPMLYQNNKCHAKIIVPKGSTEILKEMWLDSSFINCRDINIINLKYKKNYEPFYTEDIVYKTLEYVIEVDSNNIVKLSDELSIRYTDAGHILLSKQCELFITIKAKTKKILFSSDLGNIATEDSRVFINKFKPVSSANIAIVECTYNNKENQCTKNTYLKDVEKIKSIIEQYCIENNNRVLIPTFSLDRVPYILYILYSLFGNNESFNVPIIIDSPLSNKLLNCYSQILSDEKKILFDKILSWKNIKRIVSSEDSKAAIEEKGSKCIISSSGMLTAGRSVKWTQSILHEDDCIIFIGYVGEGTLAYKIKHFKENKTININGRPYKNKAQIYDLKSFSSHMQYNDLINYYKTLNCNTIYLVHSNSKKIQFKYDLERAISNNLKSTKVIAVNKGMKISL